MSTASRIAKLQETGTIYAKKIEIESRRLVKWKIFQNFELKSDFFNFLERFRKRSEYC